MCSIWLRNAVVSKWFQDWKDGLLVEILAITRILLMAVVTWHRWLLHTDMEEMVVVAVVEIKDFVAVVKIAISEEIAIETVILVAMALAMATAMVAEPTNTRMIVVAEIVAEDATPKCAFHQIQINSQFLTLMDNLSLRRKLTTRRCNGALIASAGAPLIPLVLTETCPLSKAPLAIHPLVFQ